MSLQNTFDVFPAIDLLDGKSVRLKKGQRETAEVVHDNPVSQLQEYARAGARWAHIVNLNAAFGDDPAMHCGAQSSLNVIREIVSSSPVKIQMGGGIRSRDAVVDALALGVSRVVIGTWAVTDFEDVMRLVRSNPSQFVIGVDSFGGRIAVHGWTQTKEWTTLDFAKMLAAGGVETILFTEIERDGMLTGAATETTASIGRESGLAVIASGGVRNLDDIRALAESGHVSGVITGRALAEGTLDLQQALTHTR
jgi:phosphoribosylformimino-5-aminoimidazole carboxamide ribotide isomerase